MTTTDLRTELAFAQEVARRAGVLLADRYEQVLRVRHKSPRDVVTEVDFASERLVMDAIRDAFPGDAILAEESGHHRRRRDVKLDSGRSWVLDPLDGTVNYANGIPFFCVSVGLVVDGRPAAGAVHDPMRGETFRAVADGEAWLAGARGVAAIRASEKEALTDWVVHLALGGRAVATRARAVRKAIRVSRTMGSSALGLAYVANGRFDAFVQSGGMSAWDVAAAGLIAERAGALVTDTAGGPWFDVDKATRAFGLVAAPPAHHAAVLELTGEPAKTVAPARG
jgi:myo-inositol-1(or 4)-monophosphatase